MVGSVDIQVEIGLVETLCIRGAVPCSSNLRSPVLHNDEDEGDNQHLPTSYELRTLSILSVVGPSILTMVLKNRHY